MIERLNRHERKTKVNSAEIKLQLSDVEVSQRLQNLHYILNSKARLSTSVTNLESLNENIINYKIVFMD